VEKKYMKVLWLFLLVAGPFCVWGQQRAIPRGTDSSVHLQLLTGDRLLIRSMPPDGMPCVMPDMAKMERMPVDRRVNADRMPNGAPLTNVWKGRKGQE
jgi:hypothetical protein